MKLITETEAARLMGCSPDKLQKDRVKGDSIPFYKIGRNVRYNVNDIMAYLEQQRFTSTTEYEGKNSDK